MKISFHGADQNVTGSCHLVECQGKKILIDCGLYQGGRQLKEENTEPFGFEPEEIDCLLLTHAHLDHCGRIPLLVKRGFKGEIITTSASRELAKLVLMDSGHLHEEDTERKNRRAERTGHNKDIEEPLYTVLDVLNSLDYFGRNAEYKETLTLAPGIQVTFYDAGHILGSASIHMELEENGQHKSIMFSGDLGYDNREIIRNPATPAKADIVVMETTYGDRLHKQLQPSIDDLYGAITNTFRRGGNVIIPSFALERSQELLYILREGIEKGQLPASMQVFLDSPMAISATEIFRRHPECFDKETYALFCKEHKDPFQLPGIHFTKETADSMALNNIKGGAVIMAGSGMCTGGRIRHHLKHNLSRENSSIIFVGFAAKGTLARMIVDGAKTVKLYGEVVPVRAKIYTIGGFSAHADQAELLAWHQETGTPSTTFLVHGEQETMAIFAKKLNGTQVKMPELNESYDLLAL